MCYDDLFIRARDSLSVQRMITTLAPTHTVFSIAHTRIEGQVSSLALVMLRGPINPWQTNTASAQNQ